MNEGYFAFLVITIVGALIAFWLFMKGQSWAALIFAVVVIALFAALGAVTCNGINQP